MDFELHGQGVGERRERERTVLSLLPVQTSPTTENHFGPSPTAFYGSIGTFSLPFSSPFSCLFFSTPSTSTFFFSPLSMQCNSFLKKIYFTLAAIYPVCVLGLKDITRPGSSGKTVTNLVISQATQFNIYQAIIISTAGHLTLPIDRLMPVLESSRGAPHSSDSLLLFTPFLTRQQIAPIVLIRIKLEYSL